MLYNVVLVSAEQHESAISIHTLDWEDLLKKETTTHPSILAWRIPWTEDLGGLESMGLQRVSGARGGFLPRHDEDLGEPLVRRKGSQVSMRVARGSASWLSSHGRD